MFTGTGENQLPSLILESLRRQTLERQLKPLRLSQGCLINLFSPVTCPALIENKTLKTLEFYEAKPAHQLVISLRSMSKFQLGRQYLDKVIIAVLQILPCELPCRIHWDYRKTGLMVIKITQQDCKEFLSASTFFFFVYN